ncbi:MAG: N-acetylmuramoyl-L-alanine amidase CwlD [Bacillota bacterium]|nr:N-acetylmuramoyl-L-alanine amidase CwlD [Bacillota bacterium]MDP4156753.1 N-acetylmuramoyl-L-alanine amidase CwlD [Bacillota bacterium]
MVKKRIKLLGFAAGLILLFFILQYEFEEHNSWKSWNLPLAGKIILIDPGHGGPDGGAGDKKTLEKDISLPVSLKIRDYLQEQGALVIMTRDSDKDLANPGTKGYSRRKVEDLRERLKMINQNDIDLYVSVHLNAIPSARWSGAQTFYASQYMENAKAAKFIQDELRKNLGNTNRNAKPLNSVYILKNAKKPGVLVEIGFLSNPREKSLLKTNTYQNKVAESIYRGISRYFTNEKELKQTWD